jgi:predicted short-subunit dehydrogenase-like oxidoreductase (DUF2520 family)
VSEKKSSKQSRKPRLAIVGAGNLARSLAPSLRAAGYVIDQLLVRRHAGSLRKARQLGKEVCAAVDVTGKAQIRADLLWLCVSDTAIAEVTNSLANATDSQANDWKGRVVLHSSGVLASHELAALRKRGASVASVHPMMTFVRGAQPPLDGVSFAVEGDREAVRAARKIVRDLRGHAFTIKKSDKAAYHAWGMFASPLLTALLAAGERVAKFAGVPGKSAKMRALPILRQTLANYANLGAAESFSGPIARGDVVTVEKHLRILQKLPELRVVYVALALSALRNLPAKNGAALKAALCKALKN